MSRWLLLALSTLCAIAYGTFARDWAMHEAPDWARSSLKASAVVLLALLALLEGRSALLTAALAFGAAGDALLALHGGLAFGLGAAAFLVGHVLYAILFLRSGMGLRTLPPMRLLAMAVIAIGAATSTRLLWPTAPAAQAGNALYAAALTGMTLAALTLPARCWPAMAGAVLFFVSDVLLTVDLHGAMKDALLAAAIGTASWFTYWLGQLGLCVGALRLQRAT